LLTWLLHLRIGGIGWGLDVDVCQIYDFIANNYEPGDELFFFGFSRGAFTVRSVAGLVCEVGVLSAVHMSRFTEMWTAYRTNTGGEPFRNSTWYRDNKDDLGLMNVKVKVVGVWDTVGALVSEMCHFGHRARLTDIIAWLGNPGMALSELGANGWHPSQQAILIPQHKVIKQLVL
jgi:uncharacterized protein (DUF2235 family)